MTFYALNGVRVETPGENRFWVAPNAVVIGNVKFEDDASVWFGAVVPLALAATDTVTLVESAAAAVVAGAFVSTAVSPAGCTTATGCAGERLVIVE